MTSQLQELFGHGTHAMKLPEHSFCTVANARGGLDEHWRLHSAPQYSVTPLCNVMWSATLLSCRGS